MATQLDHLVARAEQLLTRLEGLMPAPLPETDWSAHAFRWRRQQGRGYLQAVKHPHRIHLADLQDVDAQNANWWPIRASSCGGCLATTCCLPVREGLASPRFSRPC